MLENLMGGLKAFKLLGLVAKYGQLKISELTGDVIVDVFKAFDVDVNATDDAVHNLLFLLKQEDVDKVADMLNHPIVIEKIATHIRSSFTAEKPRLFA